MSYHISSNGESEIRTPKSFEKLVQEFDSLKLWKKQAKIAREKEMLKQDAIMAKLEEEIRHYKVKEKQRSQSSHKSSHRSYRSPSFQEDSQNIDDFYQPQPIKIKYKTEKVRETRVNLPHFHGKDDVETYLDWEMKVEQLFACHHVK